MQVDSRWMDIRETDGSVRGEMDRSVDGHINGEMDGLMGWQVDTEVAL